MNGRRPPSAFRTAALPPAIHEMVRRLVARWNPDKIILFGSYARGTAAPDSDADLLIVMPVDGPRRPIVAAMFGELAEVPMAKDLILVTPEGLEAQRNDRGTVFYPAVREGVVLYERGRRPAQRRTMDRAG